MTGSLDALRSPRAEPARLAARAAATGAAILALLAALLVAVPLPAARAATTRLFDNSLDRNTIAAGGSAVAVPATGASSNDVCLTASGNSGTTGPVYSCTTTTDSNGNGKLRLTATSTNRTGGLYGATGFPTSSGLDVRFNAYQYGGTGGDGIGLVAVAVDPTNPVAPASIGPSGSFGYSPSGGSPGLANGYLGVSLDVFGNFSSTASQGTGCTTLPTISGRVAGAVVVRGPGNGTVGYCGLATTYDGTSSSQVTLRASTRSASRVPVQVLINPGSTSFRSSTFETVEANSYKVIVNPVSAGEKKISGTLPTMPTSMVPSSSWLTAAGVPQQLAFGLVGSTGSLTDFHEVDSLTVRTFTEVAELAVSATVHSAATPGSGGPVNYVVTPSVLSGENVTRAITVTQTTPTGVLPVGAYGSGWACAPPSGQSVTCTTAGTSFASNTTLPAVNVIAIATSASVTQSTLLAGSSSAVASEGSNPAAAAPTAGTVATAPSGVTVTPASGSLAGGSTVTISGGNMTGATAIRIGTAAEQQAGTPRVLLPCSTEVTSSCFTVSGSSLVVSSWPSRTTSADVQVTVQNRGSSAAGAYTYSSAPATPAQPTATAGVTSATLTWTAPASNGSPITNYVIGTYINGVLQGTAEYDASTTTRTFTGLIAGSTYSYHVVARNAVGLSGASPPSAGVVPYTVPGAPTIGTVTAGTGSVTVSWSAPSSTGFSPITGYVVTPYIGAVAQSPVTFTGTTTTRTVTGLSSGTSYTFRVAAVNAAGTGAQSAASAAVIPNASPTLTFGDPPAGEVGAAYSNQFAATGGTAPYSWAITAGSLPAGLTLSSGGLLTGTPTASGTFAFTVRVTDASGQTASKALNLLIAPPPAIAFSPASGEVGVVYSQQPVVTGGTAPYTWSVSAGSLPPGVTINSTSGLVSGTPTTAGTFSATIRVVDAMAQAATRAISIVIVPPPSFTFATLPAGQVAVPYSATLAATGGVGPLTWSVSAGSLPPGLSLDSSNGAVTGTPTIPGTTAFTVRVTDANNQSATKATSITVAAGALVVTKVADRASATMGSTVRFTITVANTGTAAFPDASLTDPLSSVLDDATYNADATASTGTVSYTAPTLNWSGAVAGSATVTITYSVTVKTSSLGNYVLANTVSSSTLGTNCAASSTDTRCTATVTVSSLTIAKTANVSTVSPGGTVRFTTVATNSGQTAYTGISFADNLTGTLDDATYASDATATAGTVSFTSPNLVWSGSLAPGAAVTVTYTVTVRNPDPGDLSVTGTVTSAAAGSTCPAGNPAAACTAAVSVLVPGLAITTTASAATAQPGQSVTSTTTISNTGQTPYSGASVALALAAAVDDATYDANFTATAGSLSYVASTSILTWTGDLAVGASVTVSGTLTVRNPDPGDKVITVVASSASAGSTCPVGSGNSACTATVRVRVPALTIVASTSVVTTTPGSTVGYTVVATNNGQVDYATSTWSMDLTGVLDDATFGGTATATAGTVSFTSPTVTWTGPLAIGASATVTFSVTVRQPDPGNKTLAATVVSTTPFSTCAATSADSRCSTSVQVLIPGLAIAIAPAAPSYTPGDLARYIVTVTNNGQVEVADAEILVDLDGTLDDAAYNFDATATTGLLTYDVDLTWLLTLGVGQSATTELTFDVDDPANGDLSMSASATSAAPGSTCPTATASSACRLAIPVLLPGLTLVKTADSASVAPGSIVSYTVTVTNSGQSVQSAAGFSDSLTRVLTDAVYNGDATATGGTVSYAAPVLSWSGALAPGDSATITYSVTVKDPDPGDKVMVNTVVSPSPGSNCAAGSTDSRCTATVRVQYRGLTVALSTNLATTAPGGTVRGTLDITNTGEVAAPAATASVDIGGVLDDAAYASASASTGSVTRTGDRLDWTGALAVGATATVTYTVTVATTPGDNLLTQVAASSDEGSNCDTGSTDSRCAVTVPVARMLIEYDYVEQTATPGQVVHLAATFTNTGEVPYDQITVRSPTTGTVDDATPVGDQTATTGTLVLTATEIRWVGDIPIGESVQIEGTLTINDPATGDRRMGGTITTTAPGSNCPVGGTDPSCSSSLQVLLPGLAIAKSATTTVTAPGGTVGYTITISNNGETPYAAATVTDDMTGLLDDADYNGDATATSGSLSYSSPDLTWTGALAVGASVTVTYTATVDLTASADKAMINVVSSQDQGSSCPTATSNEDCRRTVVVLTPALTITTTADQPYATLGSDVTFTVTVANTGQTSYPIAAFTDPLGGVLDDATFVAGSLSADRGTATFTNQTVGWSGPLSVGQSATITFRVEVKTSGLGDRVLASTVTSASPGNNCPAGQGDDLCTVEVDVTNAVTLTFTNTADAPATAPGEVVEYTVTMVNSGALPIAAAGFSEDLSGILDDAAYNGDVAASSGSVSVSGGTLTWTGLSLGQTTVTVTFSVTVNQAVTGDQVLSGTLVSGTLLSSNNCTSSSADPRCTSDVGVARLRLQQSYAESSTTPGQIVNLSATFTNTGAVPFEEITVASSTAGTVDDANPVGDQVATSGTLLLTADAISWTGDIAVGETVTITGSLTVTEPALGDRLITGTLVTAAAGSNCPAGGTDPLCTAAVPVLLPQLTIAKTAGATYVLPGGQLGYTLTIRNTGETAYAGAEVTDDLTGVLDDAAYNGNAAASSGALSYAQARLTWTGDLAVGAVVTITYSVTASTAGTGDKAIINLVSSLEQGSTCPPASQLAACHPTVPLLTPLLAISIESNVTTAHLGDTIRTTVRATNTGQVFYPAASLTVPLEDAVDDAAYNSDATSTRGAVSVSGQTLTWNGALPVSASVQITYTLTVSRPATGDYDVTQRVYSASAGTGCPDGSINALCHDRVPIAALQVGNLASTTAAKPTDVVEYTVTLANPGQVDYFGAGVEVDLAELVDDADYGQDAVSTAGHVTPSGDDALAWTGDVLAGGTVVITWSALVGALGPGDRSMVSVVRTETGGSNCPDGSTDPACRSVVTILQPGLAMSIAADRTEVPPGGLVNYTVTVTNTGESAYADARVTVDLIGVVDDATPEGPVTASTGSAGITGMTFAWTGDLAVAAGAVITFSVRADNPPLGDHLMPTFVVSDELGSGCPVGTTDPACYFLVIVLLPELTMSIVPDVATTTPGSVVGYTVTLENTGAADLSDATVTADLNGVRDDGADNGDAAATAGSVVIDATGVVWSGSLAIGEVAVVTYSVTVDAEPQGDLVLRTALSSADVGALCTPLLPCLDEVQILIPALAVTVVADRATATPGDPIGFTVTLSNSGETDYADAVTTVDLAGALDDATVAEASIAESAGTATYAAPVITWHGAMAIGDIVTIRFTATVRAGPLGDKSVAVRATTAVAGSNCGTGSTDPNCAIAVTVLVPGLSITKTALTATATPGAVVGYRIVVANTGETPYAAASLSDSLGGLQGTAAYNGDAAASSGTVSYAAPVLGWTGALAVGATVTITYSVTVAASPAGDLAMVNTVVSNDPGSTCPATSPAASCTVTVQVLIPALTVTKSADRTEVVAGDQVTYTITVANTGETDYSPAVVTDDLAAVLDDAAYGGGATATTGTVTVTAGVLTWTGALAVGATATVSYAVTASFPALGDRTLRNGVVSASPGSTCVSAADSGCSTTVSVLVPALEVTKAADLSSVVAGAPVGYTIVASNSGESDYASVTLTDALDDVLDDAAYDGDAAATSGAVTVAAGVLTWTGALAAGESVTVTYTVTTTPVVSGDGDLTNTVLSTAVGSTCQPAAPAAECTSAVPVEDSTIQVGELSPSLELEGPPGSILTQDGALTMTVLTNSPFGYIVTVEAQDAAMRGSSGNPDTIPLSHFGIRESGETAWQTLDELRTLRSQDRPSSPGGDAVSADVRLEVPFVNADTYSATLEFVATAR